MLENWQSLAAPTVVILVATAFIFRAWRRVRSKTKNCGTGCGCAIPRKIR